MYHLVNFCDLVSGGRKYLLIKQLNTNTIPLVFIYLIENQ
jgi:hypothetical protein